MSSLYILEIKLLSKVSLASMFPVQLVCLSFSFFKLNKCYGQVFRTVLAGQKVGKCLLWLPCTGLFFVNICEFTL